MEESLLEKAKNKLGRPSYKTSSEQEIELALAWVRGEIGVNQVMKAINKSSNGAYSTLALALKEHMRRS